MIKHDIHFRDWDTCTDKLLDAAFRMTNFSDFQYAAAVGLELSSFELLREDWVRDCLSARSGEVKTGANHRVRDSNCNQETEALKLKCR